MDETSGTFTNQELEFRKTIENFLKRNAHKTCSAHDYVFLMGCGLFGIRWRHYKNNNIYTIVGFTWIGDLDQWCIQYIRPGMIIPFSRTIANSFGDAIEHETGHPVRRFTLVP